MSKALTTAPESQHESNAAGAARARNQRGDLQRTLLPRLLLRLYRERFCGTLILNHESRERLFLFERGAPFSFSTRVPSESLGSHLVERGILSPAEREQALRATANASTSEASALLGLGLIPARTLFAQTREHVRRYLLDCFRWSAGRWEILPSTGAWHEAHSLRIDPLSLIQSGIESHWNPRRIFFDLEPRLGCVPRPTPSLAHVRKRLERDPCVDDLLSAIDDQHTLGEILASAARSPRSLATAWLLDASGLVHYRDASEDPRAKPTENRQLGTQATEPKPTGPARGTPSMNADQLEQDIRKRLASDAPFDPYTTLGVGRTATPTQIKRAYIAAAKRYHPDTLGRLELDDLRDEASELFSRVTEAWRILGTTTRRQAYDVESHREPGDTSALVRAETFFRKGKILLRKGDFRSAVAFLAPAVEIQPEDASYHTALGWALYRQHPCEPAAALTHLRNALSLAPDTPGLAEKLQRVQAHPANEPPTSRS